MLGTSRLCMVSAVLLSCYTSLVSALPARPRRSGSRRYDDDDYFWLNATWPCPNMRCRILYTCVHQEMVLWFNGPHTCRGCPFCLDLPGRGKRSAPSPDTSENDVCEHVTCPDGLHAVDNTCRQSATLDGFVGDKKCRTCSACIESVTGESYVDNAIGQQPLNDQPSSSEE